MIRVIKCYLLATQMPEWANKYAGTFAVPSWRKFILRTAFAAPLMSLVVSAPSMVAEPLGLSPRRNRDARCGVLVVSGLCLLMSVHPLLQAYLDSGLITWYEVKEGNDKERLTETERAVVERQLGVTNHLVCKVALQIAAPALLLLSCGIGAWCYDSIDVTESTLSRGLVPPTVAASAFSPSVGSRARGASSSAPPPSPSPNRKPCSPTSYDDRSKECAVSSSVAV